MCLFILKITNRPTWVNEPECFFFNIMYTWCMIAAIIATIKTSHYNNVNLFYNTNKAWCYKLTGIEPLMGISKTSTCIRLTLPLREALALLVPQCMYKSFIQLSQMWPILQRFGTLKSDGQQKSVKRKHHCETSGTIINSHRWLLHDEWRL